MEGLTWPVPMRAWPLPPRNAVPLLRRVRTYTSALGFRGFPYLRQTSSSPSNKDHLSCLSQTTESTRKRKGVGNTLEVGACQRRPGPGSGREPGPRPEKGLLGEEAKPAGHHQPSLAAGSCGSRIWVRETSLEEDPRAFPTLRKDTGGVASGWSKRPHSVLGRARASPEKWEDPGTPNHTGTKGRRTQGWAGGRGG